MNLKKNIFNNTNEVLKNKIEIEKMKNNQKTKYKIVKNTKIDYLSEFLKNKKYNKLSKNQNQEKISKKYDLINTDHNIKILEKKFNITWKKITYR